MYTLYARFLGRSNRGGSGAGAEVNAMRPVARSGRRRVTVSSPGACDRPTNRPTVRRPNGGRASSFPTASEFSRIRAIFSHAPRYTSPTDGGGPVGHEGHGRVVLRSRRSPFDGSELSAEYRVSSAECRVLKWIRACLLLLLLLSLLLSHSQSHSHYPELLALNSRQRRSDSPAAPPGSIADRRALGFGCCTRPCSLRGG